MKTTRHGQHLTQLTQFGMMNAYFVRQEGGLTLIDALLPNSADAILEAAAETGQPITRIVLTHAHQDHVGALDDLRAALPDAEVLFHTRTAEFLREGATLRPEEPQAKLKGSYVTATTTADTLLQPGDCVGHLEVIAAPGHTPDQVAFYDHRDGTLIAGDAFQTAGGVAVAGVLRLLFPLPAMATWHLPTALQSARHLRSLEPSRLAVGHGPVLEAPLAAMDDAIQAAERKA